MSVSFRMVGSTHERQELLLQQYEKNRRTTSERDTEYVKLLENDEIAEVLMYNVDSNDGRVMQMDAFVSLQRKIPQRSECPHVLLVSGNVLTMAVMSSQLAMHRWKVSEAQTLTEATAILKEQITRAQKCGYVVGRRIEETPADTRKTYKTMSASINPSPLTAEQQQLERETLADLKGGPAALGGSSTVVPSAAETDGAPPSPCSSVCSADLQGPWQKTPPSDMVARLVIVDTFTHEPFSDIVDHLRYFNREYGLGLIIVLLLYDCYTNLTPGMLVLPQHSATLEEAYGFGYDLVLRRCFDHKVVNFCTELFMSATSRWRNDVRRRAAVGNYRSVRQVLLEQSELGSGSDNNVFLDTGNYDGNAVNIVETASTNLNGTWTLRQPGIPSPTPSSLSSQLHSRHGRADQRVGFDENIGYKNEEIGGVVLPPSLAFLAPPNMTNMHGVRMLAGGEQQQLTSLSVAKDTLAGLMRPAQTVKHAVRRKVNLEGTYSGSDHHKGNIIDENDMEHEMCEDILIDEIDEVHAAAISACQREIARLVSELERNERILYFLREEVAQSKAERANSQSQQQQQQHHQGPHGQRYGSTRASVFSLSGRYDDGFNQYVSLSKEQQIFVLKQRLLEAAEKLAGYESANRKPSHKRRDQADLLQNTFTGSIGKQGHSSVLPLQCSFGSFDTDDSARLTELFEATLTQQQQLHAGGGARDIAAASPVAERDLPNSNLAGIADSVISGLRSEIAYLKQRYLQQQEDSRVSSRRSNWEHGRLSQRNSRTEERLADAVNMIALQKRRIVQLEEVLALERKKKQGKGDKKRKKKNVVVVGDGGGRTAASVESSGKKKSTRRKKEEKVGGDAVSAVSEETQGATTVNDTNDSGSRSKNSSNVTAPEVRGRTNVQKSGDVLAGKRFPSNAAEKGKERAKKNEENVKIQKMITTTSATALMQRLDQLFGKVREAVARSDNEAAEEARDGARHVGQVYATHMQKLRDINRRLGEEDPFLLAYGSETNSNSNNINSINATSSTSSSGGNKSMENLQELEAVRAVAERFLESGENYESYAQTVVHLYSMEKAMELQEQAELTARTSKDTVVGLLPSSTTSKEAATAVDITDSEPSITKLNVVALDEPFRRRDLNEQHQKQQEEEGQNVSLIDIVSFASSLHVTPAVMLCRAAVQELSPMKEEHQRMIEEELMALSGASSHRAKKSSHEEVDSGSLDALYLSHHQTLVQLLNTLGKYHPVLRPILHYQTRELEEQIAREMSGEKKQGNVSARFLMAIDTSLLARLIVQLSQYAEKSSPSEHGYSRDGQYDSADEYDGESSTDDSSKPSPQREAFVPDRRSHRSGKRSKARRTAHHDADDVLYDDNALTTEEIARLLGNQGVELSEFPERLLDLLMEGEAESIPSEDATATADRVRRTLANIDQQRQMRLDALMQDLRQRRNELRVEENNKYENFERMRRPEGKNRGDIDGGSYSDTTTTYSSSNASEDSETIEAVPPSRRRVLSPSMYRCAVPPHKQHAILRRQQVQGQTVLGADVQGDVSAEVSKRMAHFKLHEHPIPQAEEPTGSDVLPPVVPRGLSRTQLQQFQQQQKQQQRSGSNTTENMNLDGSPPRYEQPQPQQDDDDDDIGGRVYLSYGRGPLPPRMSVSAAASVERSPFRPEELAARVLAYRLAVARQRGGHRLAADPTVYPTFSIPVAAATLPPAGGPHAYTNGVDTTVPQRGGVSAYTMWVYGVPGEQIFPMLRGADPAHSDAVLFLPAQANTTYATAAGAGRRSGVDQAASNAFIRRMLARADLYTSPAALAAQRLNAQLQMCMANWGLGVEGRSIAPAMRRAQPSHQQQQRVQPKNAQ